MNQLDANDPLKALREELADVSPSSQFAARVRQGIDASADAPRAGWLSGWRWLVPAATAAAIVIAVFVISRPRSEVPVQVAGRAPIQPSAPIPSAVVTPAPEAPVTVARVRTAASKVEPENLRTREPGNPFPEVITNQAAVLRELWARVDSKAPLVEVVAKTVPDTISEIVIHPIEVSPIVIKWLGDPSTAPVAPIIRRITADTAERSEK